MPLSLKRDSKMEQEIFKYICQLVNAWFEVKLNRQSIDITETYRSQSRPKEYIDKKIDWCWWTLEYFTPNTYRITLAQFKKRSDSLLPITPTPNEKTSKTT